MVVLRRTGEIQKSPQDISISETIAFKLLVVLCHFSRVLVFCARSVIIDRYGSLEMFIIIIIVMICTNGTQRHLSLLNWRLRQTIIMLTPSWSCSLYRITIMNATNHFANRNQTTLFFQPRFGYIYINGENSRWLHTVIKVSILYQSLP